MKLKTGKMYKTVGGDIVYISQIYNFFQGIQGKFISQKGLDSYNTWDDTSYPYLFSENHKDEFHLALTDNEVTIEEYPEYFL